MIKRFIRNHNSIIKWITILAQLILGGMSFYWVISWSKLEINSIFQRLWIASPLPLWIAILAFVSVTVLSALRYKLFLPSDIPFMYLVGTTLFQNALLTFIPWRIGEISYPLLLVRDHKVPVSRSIAVIIIIRLIDFTITATIVLLLGGQYIIRGNTFWLKPAFGLAIILPFLGSVVSIQKPNYIRKLLTQFCTTLKPLIEIPKLLILIFLSISLFVLTTIQSLYVLQAVALRIDFFNVALLNAVTLIAAILPVHPPGGWGTIDTIQVLLLKNFGYSPETSLASILAAHSIYTLLLLIGGISGWILMRKNSGGRKDGSMRSSHLPGGRHLTENFEDTETF